MPASTDPNAIPDHAPHEARRLVTVLFADLEGSTRLGEILDPELLKELLTEYFHAMAAVVAEWDGSVEKYIGDAVVAVFGVPTTREDDAIRALRAGLDMQERLEEINPSLLDRYGVELTMRIAVNTGEVVAGSNADSVLAGDVFNVAARLEGVAEPGTVVAGERTHYVAKAFFEFVPLGELTLKGKTRPEPAWQVVAPRVAAERPAETEMVGRAAETAMLEALLDQAVSARSPRLVIVAGEAGIGKTRLVREFSTLVADRMRTLVGRCLPYGKGITFWPLREILWDAAGVALDDTSEQAAAKLRALVVDLPHDSIGDPEWVAFALAATTGIVIPDNPFEQLSPESAGEELQLAWPAFATGLADDRPTLLVIEDIHWAEPPLLELAEQLALRAVGPLLIVVTARPDFMEERPGWGARAMPAQISLRPLTATSFDELMRQLLPDFDEAGRHRVLDPAGGNPFFAEEIARHVLEESPDTGKRPAPVPDTARAVLAARIDQLETEDREVLQDAAVIGEVFWPAPLEKLRKGEVTASLAALERGGFITTRPTTSLPGQREMAFRHGLMCEVAYQSIPRRHLASTHATVAEWTEELAADRREEFIEVVAYHYAAAAQPNVADFAWRDDPQRLDHVRSKAIETLVEAGEAARRRFSIDQAVDYADRALSLARTDDERLGAIELKAASYHAAARVDEAWPVYLDALSTARRAGDDEVVSRIVTEATLLWARYGGAFSDDDWKPAAVDIVQTRLAEIGEEDETLELAALLTGRSVWGRRELFDRTPEEVKADARRAISISEKVGSKKLLSHALDAYEMCLREDGLCGLGELADRMIALGSDMIDRRLAHEMLITSAIALAEVGRYSDSQRVGETAHADAEIMGVHQRIHGIRAATAHMVPTGDLAGIAGTSAGLIELIAEDGGTLCDFGAGALAARALALFELDESEDASRAVDVFVHSLPGPGGIPTVELWMLELLWPFIGPDRTDALLGDVRPLTSSLYQLRLLRAALPVAVFRRNWDDVETLAEHARSLAAPCCAPQLAALATWAEATRDGLINEAVSAADDTGEPYLAARLTVQTITALGSSAGAPVRESTAGRLARMGASATLERLNRGLPRRG